MRNVQSESFGAGALKDKLGKRAATATTNGDVVCLRLIRDDWHRVWAPITDAM